MTTQTYAHWPTLADNAREQFSKHAKRARRCSLQQSGRVLARCARLKGGTCTPYIKSCVCLFLHSYMLCIPCWPWSMMERGGALLSLKQRYERSRWKRSTPW